MGEICVFAGTGEGRELVKLLTGRGVPVHACVATEYGQTLLVITHDERIAHQARRILTIEDGKIAADEVMG